jgi:nicotinate-nucleotide adenylyltransferase
MKVGLFFGTFNPIHVGHLIIANYFAEFTDLEKIWFVVSPHNPLKDKKDLLNQYDRLHLVKLAIEDDTRFRASDIEFQLPQPSYTIDTLTYLKEKHPDYQFVLLMGSDNLVSLHKWKNYQALLDNYQIYVYKREAATAASTYSSVKVFDVPLLDVSASFIRECIREKKSVRYLLPEAVYNYLSEMNYYKIKPKTTS